MSEKIQLFDPDVLSFELFDMILLLITYCNHYNFQIIPSVVAGTLGSRILSFDKEWVLNRINFHFSLIVFPLIALHE